MEALHRLLPIGATILEELKSVEQERSRILAAYVATEVFKRRGYGGVHPLSVHVRILNPPLVKWCKAMNRAPDAAGEPEWRRLGGEVVFLGQQHAPGEDWIGHVVVIIPDLSEGRSALLDLTIPQVNSHGMELDVPPLFLPVRHGFVRGERRHEQEVNNSLLLYKALPNDLGFQTSEIWATRSKATWFVDRIIARVRQAT